MLPDDLSKLRVVDLKAELTERNLPTKGKKDELIARLQQWIDDNNDHGQNNGEQIEEQQQQLQQPVESQPESISVSTTSNEQQKEELSQIIPVGEEQQKESTPREDDSNTPADAKFVQAPVPAAEPLIEKKESQPTNEATVATETMDAEEEVQPVETKTTPAPAVEELKLVEQKEAPVEYKPVEEEKKEETKVDTSLTGLAEPIGEDSDIKGTKRKRSEPEAEKSPQKQSKARTESVAEKQSDEQSTATENVSNVTSSAIYIKGFVRPLIIRHVQELIGQYGTVKRFWMDAIKTHCYVIYESEKEAQDAFSGIDGIIFPRDTGRKVQVGGLTPEQAEILIGQEQAAASKSMKLDWEKAIKAVVKGDVLESSPTPPDQGEARRHRLSGIGQITRELQKAATASVLAPGIALLPAVEERSVHLVQTDASSGRLEQQQEPAVSAPAPTASLDELFRKTTASPNLYYLPVDESVAKQRLEKLK